MSGAAVRCLHVRKTYDAVTALHDVTLDVHDGEFLTLLGPSGSGKTTTLMLIAGFEEPTSGEILIRGESVVGRPPEARDIGMVFQSYALFPHMTVFDNVAFGLRARKVAARDVRARVDETLDVVRLAGLGRRYPRQLSGGQQQRVALARALAYRPSLLLMDEPLGALDRKLREEMQGELKAIQRRLGVTTLYVTHDQQEALAMSDRIAIMNRGDIVQVGSPLELYEHPTDEFVASFLGDVNVVEGVAIAGAHGGHHVELHPGIVVPTSAALTPGKRVRLAIRPERLRLSAGATSTESASWRGTVREIVFHGEVLRYTVELAPALGLKITQPYQGQQTVVAPGASVTVSSHAADWTVLD